MIKILAILLLIVSLTAGVFGWLWHDRGLQIATLKADNASQQRDTTTLQNTNSDQVRTIAQMKGLLMQCNAQLSTDQQANDQAKQDLAATQVKLDQAQRDAQTIRRQLYAHDQSAAAWAAGASPAGISQQLRTQWEQATGVLRPEHPGDTDHAAPVGGNRSQPTRSSATAAASITRRDG